MRYKSIKKLFLKNFPIIALLSISALFHFAFLNYPSEVVFDEVHFGKFVSAYFTGEYYFDIHPPLGKMMIAGFAKIFGFQAGFDFSQIGQSFDKEYLFILRFLPALFGTFFILPVYLLIREIGLSKKAAFLGASLVLFDTAFLAQSKFILVDIFLLFFGVLSVYFYFRHRNLTAMSLKKSFLYLAFSAVFSGLAISIKWTALSFLGIIIIAIIIDFFRGFKVKPFFANMGVFIFLALFTYFLIFIIHFEILSKSGPGNAYMAPAFQKTLENNQIKENIAPLPLFGKFIELNKAMYKYNVGITATHPYSSTWQQWALGKKPIWYWTKTINNRPANIYLIGNPAVWWSVFFAFIFSFFAIFKKQTRKLLPFSIYLFILGFFASLLPYIPVKRVTFLYHYLPALTFGILILAILYDKILNQPPKIEEGEYINPVRKGRALYPTRLGAGFSNGVKKKTKPQGFFDFPSRPHFILYFSFLAFVGIIFFILSPLAYGFPVSAKLNNLYNLFITFLS